ncbi:bifunctional tetrahydrofolate synthase/dihydrofolate synthase [Pseudoalteromonas luteoviolacea]|uniref:bifunctional tetrahydrofolate synthase/dihydrofolate synthase n=1 Tax=Pseudoalteromonas luteoviolacea TaxID=43657 RepID=UPI001EEECC29|nr:bifunctional tetrahydrofolate synthase/dihydrofolate synthase [Pseudoalteromonas luteoviolacea]MCF6442811.1 bifunctional tetrahydrofolate synthase/dihydrofolate synthase [Pseudoalteromonas luteoviolacea]
MSHIKPSQSSSLDDWLCYLEQLHPANIEMGLERVAQVANNIHLLDTPSKIILIGGTNGKGTTARCMEVMLLSQGYSVGTYASPHLIRYNERVRINGQELSDQEHVDAFYQLEQGRGETQLTYFEYGTLGALALFKRYEVDYVLLEVGLGGRYDATNIVTPYASIITTIDLDHKEYLGDTRELVGYDKAGIFRTNTPAIVGDLNIPHTVTDYGDEINADMILSKRDFVFTPLDNGLRWQYQEYDMTLTQPSIPAQNVATALTALARLDLLPELEKIPELLDNLQVEGRFQKLSDSPLVYTDVAHNPESARYLRTKLLDLKNQGFKINVLVAMLADKDKAAVINELSDVVDHWTCASLSGPRAESADNMRAVLGQVQQHDVAAYESVHLALDALLPAQEANSALIIFGSFFTVADAIQYWKK